MKSMYESILEEFLLRAKDKDQIWSFFKGAPDPAKTGYLKAYYRTSTSIVKGYYVETNSYGIEISRDECEKFTWLQVAHRIDKLIAQRSYGTPESFPETGTQINIFDYAKAIKETEALKDDQLPERK